MTDEELRTAWILIGKPSFSTFLKVSGDRLGGPNVHVQGPQLLTYSCLCNSTVLLFREVPIMKSQHEHEQSSQYCLIIIVGEKTWFVDP